MAILEEHFATAYFRFNDDAMSELRPDLRATDKQQEFVEHWGGTARNLAQSDAMRLLVTFSRMLPVNGVATASESANLLGRVPDRYLHARLQGTKLGVFDIFDSPSSGSGTEKAAANGVSYYDVWTSFSPMCQGLAGKMPAVPRGQATPARGRTGSQLSAIRSDRGSLRNKFMPGPGCNWM